jgi:hypothetical protein
MLGGQMVKPRTTLEKARFFGAVRTFKGKILFVCALDVVKHCVLMDFLYIAMRAQVKSFRIFGVLALGRFRDLNGRHMIQSACSSLFKKKRINFFTRVP